MQELSIGFKKKYRIKFNNSLMQMLRRRCKEKDLFCEPVVHLGKG